MHYKKKLPSLVSNSINQILNFEISKKIAIILGIVILLIYIGLSIPELFVDEVEQWPDYKILEAALDIWPSTDQTFNVYVKEQNTRYVRMILLDFSQEFLQNIKLLPFIASISSVVFAALISIQISKKRLAGIITMLVLLSSVTFTDFDTIAVYENFWVLFYVFSIYLIFKKPKFSSIFYILAIFSKAIFVLWLPISILVTLLSDIPKNKKIFVIITHIIVIIISLIIFQYSNAIYGNVVDIEISEFLIGSTTLASNLRFDILLLLFLLPVSVGLLLKARNGCMNSVSLIVLISGTILVTPVLEMITDYYFVYPYRYVPLVVFFAIGLATLFSKK